MLNLGTLHGINDKKVKAISAEGRHTELFNFQPETRTCHLIA